MYANYKKRGKYNGKKKMSATRRAYLAGMRKGRSMARVRTRKTRRWY